jgi:hypothetical protein
MMMVLMYLAEAYILYRKTQRLLFANKEIGLEVNTEETNYMIMCRDQHTGEYHNISVSKNPRKVSAL